MELKQLSRLRVLDLEDNWLYGNIPKELGNLTSLRVLNLGFQVWWFNGMIPEELGQLSKLRFLNLGGVNNSDWEKVYLYQWTHGYANKLRVTIPRSLGNCTKLRFLDFSDNHQLSGVILEELGKIIHLEFLSSEINNLTRAAATLKSLRVATTGVGIQSP